MNELLLAPEERTKALNKLVSDNAGKPLFDEDYFNCGCQAQLSKVLNPPKLDKPDGEGWWWHKDEFSNKYTLFVSMNDIRIGKYWVHNLPRDFDGTWQRAIVPEEEK